MRDQGQVMTGAFPRPGPVLKVVLILIAALAIVGAIVAHWAPGGAAGAQIFRWVAFEPSDLHKPWTFLTSGVLTSPESFSHALWSLVGLYFLTTDLEKKWGGARLVRFLCISVVMGNLMVLAVDRALPMAPQAIFHPGLVLGPMAAITATAMAWAKENADRQIRLFFFLPIKGKMLYWFTIGFAVLSLLFNQSAPEGAVAPFGGILAGLAFGGSPSPARSLWLRFKLGVLRRRGATLTVESLMDEPASSRRTATKRKPGGPSLRIVQGGMDDDLKNKKPKDKSFLN